MVLSDRSVSAMNIAYIVYMFRHLSEAFLLDQITGMRDCGHDVRIYSAAPPNDDLVDMRVEAY